MESIVMEFVDKDGNDLITIGSRHYIEKVIKEQVVQIIGNVSVKHTPEERKYLKGLTSNELFNVLMQYKNTIFYIYQN